MPAGQIAVYEEFARSIPGFQPTPEASQPPGFLVKPMQVGTELVHGENPDLISIDNGDYLQEFLSFG